MIIEVIIGFDRQFQKNLIRRVSTNSVYLRKVGTDEVYIAPVDLDGMPWEYEETDIKIPMEEYSMGEKTV